MTVIGDVAPCSQVEIDDCPHMEPRGTPETSVDFYKTTWRNISDDSYLQVGRMLRSSLHLSVYEVEIEEPTKLPYICYSRLTKLMCQLYECNRSVSFWRSLMTMKHLIGNHFYTKASKLAHCGDIATVFWNVLSSEL